MQKRETFIYVCTSNHPCLISLCGNKHLARYDICNEKQRGPYVGTQRYLETRIK